MYVLGDSSLYDQALQVWSCVIACEKIIIWRKYCTPDELPVVDLIFYHFLWTLTEIVFYWLTCILVHDTDVSPLRLLPDEGEIQLLVALLADEDARVVAALLVEEGARVVAVLLVTRDRRQGYVG